MFKLFFYFTQEFDDNIFYCIAYFVHFHIIFILLYFYIRLFVIFIRFTLTVFVTFDQTEGSMNGKHLARKTSSSVLSMSVKLS